MRNDSIDNFRLEINKPALRGSFYVRQGDTRARTIHVTITDNGTVKDLSDAAFCELLIKKPDGNQNDQTMVRVGNELQYTLRTQDVNVAGECMCQIMVTFRDGATLTTPTFSVMVYQKEVDQKLETSTNEYTALADIKLDVEATQNNIESYVDAKEASIRNYEAKATTAASNAATSSNNAAASASEAEGYATSAASYDENCAAAVTSCQGYSANCADYLDDVTGIAATKLDKKNPVVSGSITISGGSVIADNYLAKSGHKIYFSDPIYVDYNNKEYNIAQDLDYIEKYVTITLVPKVNTNTSNIATNTSNISSLSGSVSSLNNTVSEQGSTIASHTHNFSVINGEISALQSSVAENAEDIAENTADIEELKRKTDSGIPLTSTSPLLTSTSATINGMDALGESKQTSETNLASGNVQTTSNAQDIILNKGSYKVSAKGTLADGYWYVGAWDRTSGVAMTTTSIVANGMSLNGTNTWYYGKETEQSFEFTLKDDAKVRIGKANANNTIPLVVVSTSPTPTNPISIVDASGDVTCRTEDNTQSNTITLPTLRSVGDVKDELIVSKDGSGKLIRRVGHIKINEMTNFGYNSSLGIVYASVPSKKIGLTNFIAEAFSVTDVAYASMTNGQSRGETASSTKTYINFKSEYTSADALKSACGTTSILYELATPTETTLTTSEVASILALKTYDGTTIIDSELDVTIDYVGNTKGYIDTKTDYSYTDTIIGTWADGKPLHRMVIDVKSPSSINADVVVSNVINTSTISLKDIRGVVHASNTDISINSQIVSGYFTSAWIDSQGLKMLVSNNSYANKPCEIIVEYTIEDESGISTLSEGGDD